MTSDIQKMMGMGPGDHRGWKCPANAVERRGRQCLGIYLMPVLLQACSVEIFRPHRAEEETVEKVT